MILAFSIGDIVQVPFGWLLSWLYQLTTNYGAALILFALLVKLILFPASAKSKKSTMKMSRLSPRLQELQKKYANDQQKQGEAIQALYKEEGVSMGGGCLWSLLPLLILWPLFTVVREPIVYMLHETAEVAGKVVEIIKEADGSLFSKNTYYNQMIAAAQIPNFTQQLKDAGISLTQGINFHFLGIDLSAIPQFNIFAKSWSWDWAHIGSFLLALSSASTQLISMFVATRLNNSVVTNDKGIQDKDAVKNSQANQQSKMMMWIMPIMSLWIGFTVPGAMSLYWFAQGVVSIVIDVILTLHYRKIYDAEDAERLRKHMEQEAIEAEKERLRAERRAANPDGITANTSKKKLQQAKQREEEAAKAAAAKEYAAKKGLTTEEPAEKTTLSGIPDRPYCKGRAYDPNRYRHTEE